MRLAAFTNRYQEEMNIFYRQLKSYVKDGDTPVHEAEEEEEEESSSKKKNKRSIFGRTLKYFLRYRLEIVVLFLTYALTAVVSIAWPYLRVGALRSYS